MFLLSIYLKNYLQRKRYLKMAIVALTAATLAFKISTHKETKQEIPVTNEIVYQNDVVVDGYTEYHGSVITEDDLIVAFYPCIYFSATSAEVMPSSFARLMILSSTSVKF